MAGWFPFARNIASTGNDAIFTNSWPLLVVDRAGKELGTGWTGTVKLQWQCNGWQQFIGRDGTSQHGIAAGSNGSPCKDRLPMSETASSAVKNLKAVRIRKRSVCRGL